MPKRRRRSRIPTPVWERERGAIGSQLLSRSPQFYATAGVIALVLAALMIIGLGVGKKWLDDGYGITIADLDKTAKLQGVTVKRGDFVVVRTGQMEAKLEAGSWDGYPGGDAPGFSFETLEWIKRTELAALASDTWGCEVRPNESEQGINQPWHWITIPIMGMTMGEIFNLKELADDCAADKVYEFLFVAPAIPITGAVGSPVNPLAIK